MRGLKLEDFAANVGADYSLDSGDSRLSLVLEEANALGQSMREGGSFSLLFRGPLEPLLPQGIYTLRHEGDPIDIFLVPIGQDPGGTRYEAIFN